MANQGNLILDAYSADFIRHWSPISQHYAGCDALLTFLDNDWRIEGTVSYDEFWHGGARRIVIYQFVLVRADERVIMRVIGNPPVERLLRETGLWYSLVPKRPGQAQTVRMRQPGERVLEAAQAARQQRH